MLYWDLSPPGVKVPYTIHVSNQIPTRKGPAKSPTAQPAFTVENMSDIYMYVSHVCQIITTYMYVCYIYIYISELRASGFKSTSYT